MKIKLDLHVHTNGSFDSSSSLVDMLKAAKKRGLSGIAVANHNRITDIAAELKNAPQELRDMIVISACEYSTDKGHVLAYFLDEDIAKGLERTNGWYSFEQVCRRAKSANTPIFFAHPFAPQIEKSQEEILMVDGYEAYNARIMHSRIKDANQKAQQLAKRLDKPFTAGSDAHFANEVGYAYWECELSDEILKTGSKAVEDEIRTQLLAGNGKIYGGVASPLSRPKSQWIRLKSFNKKRRIYKVIPRYVRAVFQSLKPIKEPEFIDMSKSEKEV